METQINEQPIYITGDKIVSGEIPIKRDIKIEEDTPKLSTSYPHLELLDALYFIWEAAERGQLGMFLMGDTARQVIEQGDLSGDKITVGVRRNEWDSGQGRIAQTYLEHELGNKPKEDEGLITIKARNAVPIHIKLYEENPTISSFNIVYYRYETFNLPNPWSKFIEEYE